MNGRTRTRVVAVVAALAAVGGGAFVANASDHASFAPVAAQDGPRFGGPPQAGGEAPPGTAPLPPGTTSSPS
jgi:hypothetical protein